MVRSRRERGEIIMDVLRVALKEAKKTHIMYRANLNPRSFNRCFPELLRKGLLVRYKDSDGDDLYRTTDKGKALLRMGRVFYENLPGKRPHVT